MPVLRSRLNTQQAVVVSCVSDSNVSDVNTLSIGSMATVTPQSSLLRQHRRSDGSQWPAIISRIPEEEEEENFNAKP